MRCKCCDVVLTDFETTRKSLETNDYYDMCNNCFKTIKEDLFYKERIDLITNNDLNELEDNLYLDNFLIDLDDY